MQQNHVITLPEKNLDAIALIIWAFKTCWPGLGRSAYTKKAAHRMRVGGAYYY
jgi:hypothetical protein